MAEYTNNRVEIEDLPKGIQIDGVGDIHPEGGDDVKVPLMENGEPYPAHVLPEDPEKLDNPDGHDTGTEGDNDCGVEADWDDDEEEEEEEDWSTRADEDAAESDSPHDRFSHFAGVSAALLSDALRSILSVESIQQLEFGTQSGDVWAYFSIKIGK